MKPTIIFLSGLAVPKIIAKSKFVWNDPLWQEYNRIYITSKIPTSDVMVEKELERLSAIINKYTDTIVAGHSLGAWWAANLACHKESKFKKLVMLTPLGDTSSYPIFNVTPYFHPWNRVPNKEHYGPHNVLINVSKRDFIVPAEQHGENLIRHFNATRYTLSGGHFYQSNHLAMLKFMQEWIDI